MQGVSYLSHSNGVCNSQLQSAQNGQWWVVDICTYFTVYKLYVCMQGSGTTCSLQHSWSAIAVQQTSLSETCTLSTRAKVRAVYGIVSHTDNIAGLSTKAVELTLKGQHIYYVVCFDS